MLRMLAIALALSAAAAGAQAKDTLSLGMVLEPPHLDPTAGAASAIREVTYANLYEGLVRIDAQGEVQPALAASWTVSPDGLTYTFRLRTGVAFHDGAPFDCGNVTFSFGRAMAPDSVNAQKGLFEPIARTECTDPATAVVTLKRPTASFLFGMGWGDAVMLSAKSVGEDKTNPVGTGPFRFRRWVRGDRIEMERFPGYWGTQPKLAAVTFRFMSDPAAAAAAVMAGDLDAFPNFPAPETLDRLKGDPRFAVVVGTTEGKTILALNDARKPFDDVRVRRALAYAIDRRALIDGVMSGYGAPIGSHYVPSDPGYLDLTGAYPLRPHEGEGAAGRGGRAARRHHRDQAAAAGLRAPRRRGDRRGHRGRPRDRPPRPARVLCARLPRAAAALADGGAAATIGVPRGRGARMQRGQAAQSRQERDG